jgi:glycosyltransferase involved in cell wall biosynthesis
MNKLPFVSIIVIVINFKNHIRRCLESLESLNYPRDRYEIVVVDGGSTDGTKEICQEFDTKFIVTEWKNRGKARNIGVKNAKGEIIAFIDADCQAIDDWLIAHVKAHNSELIGAVAGSIVDPHKSLSNGFATATHVESFAEFDENSPRRFTYHFPNGNVSFKRHIFSKVGFFDEIDAYEDFLLGRRITQMGFRILFVPAAKVLHFGMPPIMTPNCYIKKEIERAKAHFHAQTVNQKIFGRLPMHRFGVVFFAPSIVFMRTFREIYKLISTSTSQSFEKYLILPHLIIGGFVWSFAYLHEVCKGL